MEGNSKIESEILEWVNKVRTNPKSIIPHLQERYESFKEKNYKKGEKWIATREGDVAVKEAIEFLKEHPPQKPIATNENMQAAADEHRNDMSKNGITGHTGSNGSTLASRVEKMGKWKGGVSQNVAYQQETGLEYVMYWLIDDGMATRADRKNIFNIAFGFAGISAGTHPKFKTCAVMVLCGDFIAGEGGKIATHLLNDYEKNGYDQLGVNSKVFNYKDMQNSLKIDMAGDLKKDWIPGAVACRTEKSIVKDGDKEKTMYTLVYTMGDGSIERREQGFDYIVPNS
jgi:uncharacterized protein YkwD